MKKLWIILAMLALASCESAPAAYKPMPLDFAGKLPIKVDVAEIRIIENYQAPLTAPNVEQDFPTPPAVAVKQWAKERVFATGSRGVLEIAINDASVKEVKLKKTDGIKGLFTDDQDARYDAKIAVTIKLYNGTETISTATADINVSRSHSINEKATIDDRLKLFDAMTRDMMTAFNAQAELRFRQYFGAYLK